MENLNLWLLSILALSPYVPLCYTTVTWSVQYYYTISHICTALICHITHLCHTIPCICTALQYHITHLYSITIPHHTSVQHDHTISPICEVLLYRITHLYSITILHHTSVQHYSITQQKHPIIILCSNNFKTQTIQLDDG